MSYEKQTWETGEVITAEKLNHLEGGVGDNSKQIVFVPCTYANSKITISKNFNEIEELYNSGAFIILRWEETDYDGEAPNAKRLMSFPVLNVEDQGDIRSYYVTIGKYGFRNESFFASSRTGELTLNA